MPSYIRPFGNSKILLAETVRKDFALTPAIALEGDNPSESLFIPSSQKITISGIPLTLSQYIESIPSEFSTGTDSHMYALNIILKDTIDPLNFDPSSPIINESSFVWYGNRLTFSQDNNTKSYMDIYCTVNPSLITQYQIIISGMPLSLNKNRELIMCESEYSVSDIEEYTEVVIGGVPLSAGRINNNWYLIVHPL